MSDYGLKISLPGYDVQTATPEQCALHSSYPPLKAKAGMTRPHFALLDVDFTSTVTQNTTHTLYEIEHGYGYIPFTIANIVFTSHSGTDAVGIGFAGIGANLSINAYCDASNFYVTIYDNFNWTGSNARLQVSYWIFAENGT